MSSKYDLDVPYFPESPETTETETTETVADGQETDTESKQTEVPEETGQTEETVKEETTETTEETKETETTEKKERPSDRFTTDAGAIKAAENLAVALGEEVNFKKMTGEEVRNWYDDNRSRLGSEGFKGDRAKAKELNKAIKEDEKRSSLEEKLDNFLEAQKPKKEETQVIDELSPPTEPIFDWDAYQELLTEDFAAAIKMQRDYDVAVKQYYRDLMKYEGENLGKNLKPFIETTAEGYKQIIKERQEAEQDRADKKEWTAAEDSIKKFVDAEYGDGHFKSFRDSMDQLVRDNFHVYRGIAEAEGKARAIFRIYQDAAKEKTESEREARIAELEATIAKLKNGETIDQINAAKGAARITQSNGGVTQKTSAKQTPQEAFEATMRSDPNEDKYSIRD